LQEHNRIIFNGDGYSKEWVEEATRRGLPILKTLPEAVQLLSSPKNIKIFQDLRILSSVELASHQHTIYENFIKGSGIEVETMIDMVQTGVIPASFQYLKVLKDTVGNLPHQVRNHFDSL
jgi:glutamine synthetase